MHLKCVCVEMSSGECGDERNTVYECWNLSLTLVITVLFLIIDSHMQPSVNFLFSFFPSACTFVLIQSVNQPLGVGNLHLHFDK